MGEGYNGFTKDWAIVDVPPGTKRVEMEGVGGAKEEVTWQRYNGVRRSKFIPDGAGEVEIYGEREREREREREVVETREVVVDSRDRGRRFVAEKTKEDVMWTEITKDLVIREAIEASGYGFEETEFFFYVMDYLRYVSFFIPFPISESFLLTGGFFSWDNRTTCSSSSICPRTSAAIAKSASARFSGSANICPCRSRGGDNRSSWSGMRRGFLRGRSFMSRLGRPGGICARCGGVGGGSWELGGGGGGEKGEFAIR